MAFHVAATTTNKIGNYTTPRDVTPPVSAKPRGWGISVSRTGEFQTSVITPPRSTAKSP